jgi:hypothetical protein
MSSAPQRKIREEDLLFWAQKILGRDALPALIDFRDGVLMLHILQRVLSNDPQIVKALRLAGYDPATTQAQRVDNLALVDAVLRENGSEGLAGSGGDAALSFTQIESGHEGAISSLLLVLYRFYCIKSTSEVRRVKVRTKIAKVRAGRTHPLASAHSRASTRLHTKHTRALLATPSHAYAMGSSQHRVIIVAARLTCRRHRRCARTYLNAAHKLTALPMHCACARECTCGPRTARSRQIASRTTSKNLSPKP